MVCCLGEGGEGRESSSGPHVPFSSLLQSLSLEEALGFLCLFLESLGHTAVSTERLGVALEVVHRGAKVTRSRETPW